MHLFNHLDQTFIFYSLLAFAIAWVYLLIDNGDDDEGGGGMLQPVYQGSEGL